MGFGMLTLDSWKVAHSEPLWLSYDFRDTHVATRDRRANLVS